jgi:hypothetical protein
MCFGYRTTPSWPSHEQVAEEIKKYNITSYETMLDYYHTVKKNDWCTLYEKKMILLVLAECHLMYKPDGSVSRNIINSIVDKLVQHGYPDAFYIMELKKRAPPQIT